MENETKEIIRTLQALQRDHPTWILSKKPYINDLGFSQLQEAWKDNLFLEKLMDVGQPHIMDGLCAYIEDECGVQLLHVFLEVFSGLLILYSYDAIQVPLSLIKWFRNRRFELPYFDHEVYVPYLYTVLKYPLPKGCTCNPRLDEERALRTHKLPVENPHTEAEWERMRDEKYGVPRFEKPLSYDDIRWYEGRVRAMREGRIIW